jgi:hypothetical protein
MKTDRSPEIGQNLLPECLSSDSLWQANAVATGESHLLAMLEKVTGMQLQIPNMHCAKYGHAGAVTRKNRQIYASNGVSNCR